MKRILQPDNDRQNYENKDEDVLSAQSLSTHDKAIGDFIVQPLFLCGSASHDKPESERNR